MSLIQSQSVLYQLLKDFILSQEWENDCELMEHFLAAYYHYIDHINVSKPSVVLPEFCRKLWNAWKTLSPSLPKFDQKYHYKTCLVKHQRTKETCGVILTTIAHHPKDPQILLVRSVGAQKWSFPKGKMKKGESHLECGQRELKEEVGIHKDEYEFLDKVSMVYSNRQTLNIFIAQILPENKGYVVASETTAFQEIEEIQWFPMSQIDSKLLTNRDGFIWRKTKPILSNKVDLSSKPDGSSQTFKD